MANVIEEINNKQKKKAVVDIRPGDTVRVHQKVREGGKERIQIFEGLVIRVTRKSSLTSSFIVRRIASGVGVEKSFLIHSPAILKVEVVRRSKVRRNYLTYMRARAGKGTRLSGIEFDRDAVNAAQDATAAEEEAKIHEQQLETHDEEAEARAEEKAREEAKAQAAIAAHDEKKSEIEKPKDQTESKEPAKPKAKK